MPLLKVDQVHVFYGDSHIVRGVSLSLGENESIAIMGRNGMGKTTLLKALIGMLPIREGVLEVNGQELTNTESFSRVAAGWGYIPRGRMIFVALQASKTKAIPSFIYEVFPVLEEMKDRRGGNLSGGQQQQLAIARALVNQPKILLLDEPTEGIQPSIIKDIAAVLNGLKVELGFSLV